MAEGCREKVRRYKIDDEGIPTSTTREQVREYALCRPRWNLSNPDTLGTEERVFIVRCPDFRDCTARE